MASTGQTLPEATTSTPQRKTPIILEGISKDDWIVMDDSCTKAALKPAIDKLCGYLKSAQYKNTLRPLVWTLLRDAAQHAAINGNAKPTEDLRQLEHQDGSLDRLMDDVLQKLQSHGVLLDHDLDTRFPLRYAGSDLTDSFEMSIRINVWWTSHIRRNLRAPRPLAGVSLFLASVKLLHELINLQAMYLLQAIDLEDQSFALKQNGSDLGTMWEEAQFGGRLMHIPDDASEYWKITNLALSKKSDHGESVQYFTIKDSDRFTVETEFRVFKEEELQQISEEQMPKDVRTMVHQAGEQCMGRDAETFRLPWDSHAYIPGSSRKP